MGTQRYGTARTFAFIGFIFYVIVAVVGILGLLFFGLIFATSISVSSAITPVPTSATLFPFSIAFALFLIFLIPAAILAFVAWSTVKAIDSGRIAQARTNSLILGIVGLVFGAVISGIFFLLAYANLGEPYQQSYQPYQPQPPPAQPQPQTQTQRYCVNCGNPIALTDIYCPHCGKQQPT